MHAAQKGNAPSPTPTPNPNTLLPAPTGESEAVPDYQAIAVWWNTLAQKHGFAGIRDLTNKRREKLRKRLAEGMTLESVAAALDKAGSFLRDGSWFSFDWLIDNRENWLKLIEGRYMDKNVRDTTHKEGDIKC